jgi:hypothetical protein
MLDLEGERGFELLKQSPGPMRIVPIPLQLCRKAALRLHAAPASRDVHVGKLQVLTDNFSIG